MREMLFRGKRIDTGEWIEGSLAYVEENFFIVLPYIKWNERLDCEAPVFIPVDPDTIGQYTGILDKNGVKIFEGDIVLNRPEDLKAVVKYGEYNPEVTERAYGVQIHLHGLYATSETGNDLVLSPSPILKVIGNIYDNPELLEWNT